MMSHHFLFLPKLHFEKSRNSLRGLINFGGFDKNRGNMSDAKQSPKVQRIELLVVEFYMKNREIVRNFSRYCHFRFFATAKRDKNRLLAN